MERIYSNENQRNGTNINLSPINVLMDGKLELKAGGSHHSSSPISDTNRFNNRNVDSRLIRYLRSASPSMESVHSNTDNIFTPANEFERSRMMIENQYSNNKNKSNIFGSRASLRLSPLSTIDNLHTLSPSMLMTPPGFYSSAKDDEDVLVMDGISVGSMTGGRIRSAMESSVSSSSPGSNFYKSESCKSWEDSGTCRFGSNCLFAHGKEELHPTRFSIKSKPKTCKSYVASGMCMYGTKCKFSHPVTKGAESESPTKSLSMKLEQASYDIISINGHNWSPQDDGIDISLPTSTLKHPTRDDVDAYIHGVLYGPTRRRRLPVFAEICPDHNIPSHPY